MEYTLHEDLLGTSNIPNETLNIMFNKHFKIN